MVQYICVSETNPINHSTKSGRLSSSHPKAHVSHGSRPLREPLTSTDKQKGKVHPLHGDASIEGHPPYASLGHPSSNPPNSSTPHGGSLRHHLPPRIRIISHHLTFDGGKPILLTMKILHLYHDETYRLVILHNNKKNTSSKNPKTL
jgi:hypothetical protein